MATTVDFIIERVGSLLQDTGHIRWTLVDLTDYINEAQSAVVKKVPSANVTTAALTLIAGTQQSLPADGVILQKVVRNFAGGSPGAFIRQVDMEVQEATNPDWHTATATVTVEEYMYNPIDPYVFWVSPPQTGTPTIIQIKYAAIPATINPGDNLTVGDEYVNAVMEYMLHRAYSREAEYAGPEGRAAIHLAQFTKELSGR